MCPIGIAQYGKHNICPGLSFKAGTASCALAGIVPIGDGCCISARAYAKGRCYDFASLPPNIKISLAQKLLGQKGVTYG